MASVMKEFAHLKIHLEELKKATNSFSSKVIGIGGFGKVYEGEVSHSRGRSIVAIKRLNREFGQGDPEFLKEIVMLSRYTHKNLISLLGFCDEDGEKILVYEHASKGSLDRHLSSTVLTWSKRLKICLDVARGLAYLHDHKGTQQRVIHRDIKSSNILLDDNWNAKLSDMGLSKIGPANQPHTVLFTNIAGTPGYCDPQYMVMYALTKESDIYSFGVVLFEVLCGRLCFNWTNNQLEILVPMWKQRYIHKKLDQIIFKDLIPTIDPSSLRTFSDIAFQCLHDSREERPTLSLLVKKLEIALKLQEQRELKQDNATGTSQKGKSLYKNTPKAAVVSQVTERLLSCTLLEEEQMVKILQLALDCVATYPDKRPDAQLVLQQLEEIR
ncbi:putative receptor-like protein kinase At5g39000 [Bidens hawaiensis]|uniref:putative receptor-like protein kinase At5g39000 n=1 Tax=Bidens hawaiensis TaxID=980011 RepID=UPI00404B4840